MTPKASHVRNKPGNSATLASAQDKSVRIFAMRQLEIELIQLDSDHRCAQHQEPLSATFNIRHQNWLLIGEMLRLR
jgi:hypothetical protein